MTPLNRTAIIDLLGRNDLAVGRALVHLNNRQTQDEQRDTMTKHQNGRGFRPSHAFMGTSMARYFLQHGSLSAKQLAYWRTRDKAGNMRIGMYWSQLVEEAQKKVHAQLREAA